MAFEFATTDRLVFGNGSIQRLGELVSGWGRKALMVTGVHARHSGILRRQMEVAGVTGEWFAVSGEPTVEMAMAGAQLSKTIGCDLVIACGGGAVIDAGKAIAALIANPGHPLDYLEIAGRNQPLPSQPVPFAAIPTTAGTGAEVTRNAVLKSTQHRVKVSLRSPMMLPKLALVDPELTYDLPPALTASTGLDALTQVLEPFVSIRANPLTDSFCREGLRRVGSALRRAYLVGTDREARESMSFVSVLGGLALANAGLGAVHGFAGPLGGMFPAPHGAVCAALLAPVWDANVDRLQREPPHSQALARYAEAAQLLTGNPNATIAEGSKWLHALTKELCVPSLSHWGATADDISEISEKASKTSSMKGNPIGLSQSELESVLRMAI